MAMFDVSGIEDIIHEMQRLQMDISPVAEEMVDAAAEEVAKAWRETAEEYGFVDTGQMVASTRPDNGPVKRASGVLYKDIYPHGKDSKGVRNAQKAFILHYGRSNMKASYWVDEANEKASGPVTDRITEIWNRFLNKGSG